MTISTAGRAVGIVAMLVAALTAPGADAAVRDITANDFPLAMLAAAQLGALLTSGWVLLVLLGGLAQVRVPGVPATLRAVLFTTVVLTAVAGPAHADSAHHLDGLTLPDRPVAARTPLPSVTVRPGDTLWRIAADRLPAGASPQDVTRAVARWHGVNRDVVGPDPDLILPGQVLAAPTLEQDAS